MPAGPAFLKLCADISWLGLEIVCCCCYHAFREYWYYLFGSWYRLALWLGFVTVKSIHTFYIFTIYILPAYILANLQFNTLPLFQQNVLCATITVEYIMVCYHYCLIRLILLLPYLISLFLQTCLIYCFRGLVFFITYCTVRPSDRALGRPPGRDSNPGRPIYCPSVL